MTRPTFKCGDIVIAKPGNPGGYSFTSDKAVCEVERVGGNEIRVKIIAVLEGHAQSDSTSLSAWGVDPRHFEFYDLEKHGSRVTKGAIPAKCRIAKIPGIYISLPDTDIVTVNDPKLKSFGKKFTVKERFSTGFVNIGSKRPIIIRKEKLTLLDAAPVVGDFVIRSNLNDSTSMLKSKNIYKVLEITQTGAFKIEHVYGENPVERTLMVQEKSLLRVNTGNAVVLTLFGESLLQEAITELKAKYSARKFWMIASHIEGGIYPPEHPDGLYAPRRKIYSKTVAERILTEMIERHGKRFYLLEAVMVGAEGEEPHALRE